MKKQTIARLIKVYEATWLTSSNKYFIFPLEVSKKEYLKCSKWAFNYLRQLFKENNHYTFLLDKENEFIAVYRHYGINHQFVKIYYKYKII